MSRLPQNRATRGGRVPPPPRSPAAIRAGGWPGLVLGMVLAALLLVAAGPEPARGDPIRRIGQNPRGLALGGTGVSYANDEMALFYNPAGLGAIDNFWFELFPIAVEASDDALDLISDAGSFDSAAAFIREHIGDDIQFRGFAYPHAVVNLQPGVTVGGTAFLELQTEIRLRNQATPEAEAFFRQDTGQVVGISFPLLDGAMLWGISLRNLSRESGEGSISSADLAIASAKGELDIEELLNIEEGSGTGFDVGLIWRLESFSALRGQFGAVIQNVGGLDLGDAGEVPQEISFGWSFQPQFTPLVPVMFAIEFRDVTKEASDDDSNGKRTHFGVEVGIYSLDQATNMVTFRVGVNGASASFGIEFSLWHSFTIQYVVYEQEFGDAAGEDPRPRQILQFNLIGF